MHKRRRKKLPLRVTVRDPHDLSNPRIISVTGGRFQWALHQLMEAGRTGLTAADLPPGTAWNRYIHELRRLGFKIETVHERHGGEFAGTHGRFRLRSIVTIDGPSPEEAAPDAQLIGGEL